MENEFAHFTSFVANYYRFLNHVQITPRHNFVWFTIHVNDGFRYGDPMRLIPRIVLTGFFSFFLIFFYSTTN